MTLRFAIVLLAAPISLSAQTAHYRVRIDPAAGVTTGEAKEGGVEVGRVSPNSLASEAGVQPGDHRIWRLSRDASATPAAQAILDGITR